jgi:hypothetical protein
LIGREEQVGQQIGVNCRCKSQTPDVVRSSSHTLPKRRRKVEVRRETKERERERESNGTRAGTCESKHTNSPSKQKEGGNKE